MIIPKHYKRKRRKGDYKDSLSMYNTQATSFLKLQQQGKQKIVHKEKSSLESLLPLVAASLTPFALQAQSSCSNLPGVIGNCGNPEIETIDFEGDGVVDMEVISTFGFGSNGTQDIGAAVRFPNNGTTVLSSGYIGYAPYFYFNAYAQGAPISGVNDSPQSFTSNAGCITTVSYGWLDYDPTNPVQYPNPNGAWNGQAGSSPGLYMAFKKDGVLGFVELIYDDATNIVTIGNYGIACDASFTSIVAGDCSSLVGPAIPLTITITEDVNDDGTIDASESSGDVDVLATLPAQATAGDMLVIDDGINPPVTITLTATDITAGTVSTIVPLPPDGTTLTVTGTLTSGCGLGMGSDVAVINIPLPPIVNDNCDGAIGLVVGSGSCAGTTLSSDNTTATDSGEIPAPSCGNYQGSDQWFSLVVPASGNVTIETYINGANAFQDSAISAYSGSCNGGLTEIACNDDVPGQASFFSLLELTGQVPGSTIYIRAWEFGNEAEAKGDFLICAWDPNNCPDYSAATGTPLTGMQTADADFESDDPIDSDQIIDMPATMVDYDSAVSVHLIEGFEVRGGVEFHAFIDGCVGNGL